MIHGRVPAHRVHRFWSGSKPLRDRLFSLRFLAGLGAGITLCVLIFLGPALYFVEQNYGIFQQLAYDSKPALLRHLEHELIWLRAFFCAGFVATLGVSLYFGRRLLRSLLAPMERTEDHLRALTRGEWWTGTPELPGPDSDRGFFLTYEYFHHSLRDRAEAELRLLEKIVVDPAHRDSYEAWKILVERHRSRLGISVKTVTGISASSFEAAPSRRAS